MKYIKEELEKLIFEDNLSYDAIGKLYGCTGANIRKVSKKLGIELPKRRKIGENETFNKGRTLSLKNKCLNCGEEISSIKKYCNNKCQQEYLRKEFIKRWKEGSENGEVGLNWKQLSGYIRTYLFEKYQEKCSICGWGEMNPYSKTVPLEIDHIDGNAQNCAEENLRLICPNCHSLTSTYRGLNKGKGTRDIKLISNKET